MNGEHVAIPVVGPESIRKRVESAVAKESCEEICL